MIDSPVLEAPPDTFPAVETNRILVAEDHPVSRTLLSSMLESWGFEVVSAEDGDQAAQILESEDAPSIAILDWMMPGMDGPALCQRVRQNIRRPYTYLLLLSAKNKKEELASGLESGADDYVTKPYDGEELRARLKVGQRVVALERALQNQVGELEGALAHVKQLRGLVPICIYCKKIRDDRHYWHQLEVYMHNTVGTDFSHGVCPGCYESFMRELNMPDTHPGSL